MTFNPPPTILYKCLARTIKNKIKKHPIGYGPRDDYKRRRSPQHVLKFGVVYSASDDGEVCDAYYYYYVDNLFRIVFIVQTK